jgi:hypothetical protein
VRLCEYTALKCTALVTVVLFDQLMFMAVKHFMNIKCRKVYEQDLTVISNKSGFLGG